MNLNEVKVGEKRLREKIEIIGCICTLYYTCDIRLWNQQEYIDQLSGEVKGEYTQQLLTCLAGCYEVWFPSSLADS